MRRRKTRKPQRKALPIRTLAQGQRKPLQTHQRGRKGLVGRRGGAPTHLPHSFPSLPVCRLSVPVLLQSIRRSANAVCPRSGQNCFLHSNRSVLMAPATGWPAKRRAILSPSTVSSSGRITSSLWEQSFPLRKCLVVVLGKSEGWWPDEETTLAKWVAEGSLQWWL